MNYSIVYSSRTGNTKLLAETLSQALPEEGCIYFGQPHPDALNAPRIYVGFWTDKGTCDQETLSFLKTLRDREVFLFGTAGFGGSDDYFQKILDRVAGELDPSVSVMGHFMCQGKMPRSVRERYETMKQAPQPIPNLDLLIENFDRALSHPDAQDLEGLRRAAAFN